MTSPEPTSLYPVPSGPGVESGPLATWARLGESYNARAELAQLHAQVEEMRETAYRAYVSERRRLAGRAQADDLLDLARRPPESAPPPETVRDGSDQPPLDDGPLDGDDSLASRAAALFRTFPDVSRDTVQAVLGCNSYQAKRLHAEKATGR